MSGAASGLALASWLWRAQWRAQPGRLAAATLSIAIGVALALAIHLVNHSALAEFDAALAVVNGQAQARIEARAGSFDESLYPRVATAPGIAAASPVVETVVTVSSPGAAAGHAVGDAQRSGAATRGREEAPPDALAPARDEPLHLRVIGIDPMRAAGITPELLASVGSQSGPGAGTDLFADDAIFPSPHALDLLGVQVGDHLEVIAGSERVSLRVAGTARHVPGNVALAVMDLGTLQWRLGWLGRLSRLDLRLEPGVTPAMLAEPARLALPPDVVVSGPQEARQRMSNLSRAYRVNLTVLALVALFTGGFIVHSAISLAVARQQSDFALLAVLGARRGFIVRQAVGLALSAGVAGTVLGLVGGVAGARVLLDVVGGDLGGGYFDGSVPALALGPAPLAAFAAAGIATALAGGIAPALRIARQPAARALRSASIEALLGLRVPLGVPLAALALGAVLLAAPPVAGLPLPAYLAIALWLLAGIALVPHGLALAAHSLGRDETARLGPLAWLAMQRIAAMPGGAGAALGGIVASVALATAMAIMVTSFRNSVADWLDSVLPADLYGRIEATAPGSGLEPAVQARIAATPGVARVEFLQVSQLTLDPARPPVRVLARPLDPAAPQERLPLTGTPRPAPPGTIPVWVSEAIVDLYGWRPGEEVPLPLAQAGGAAGDGSPAARFFVAGVWRDYARQSGSIVITQAHWQALTGETRVTEFAVWLDEGAQAGDVAGRLRKALGPERELRLRSAAALRAMSLRIFDRSFAVTWALEAVAIVVALFGVASAWSAEALARKREFGMLRHLGIGPGGIVRQFALEAGMLAGAAVAWGVLLGAAIALVLVHRVNPQSFHWTMDVSWPFAELFVGAFVLVALAVAVAVLAARQSSGVEPVRAVRDDW